TFIPARHFGFLGLPGLVMFSMYMLAVVVALLVALLLNKFHFKKQKHILDFIHLPHYRMPNWPELARYVWVRVYSFLRKAGTIIAGMAILLWVILSFPRIDSSHPEFSERKAAVEQNTSLTSDVRALKLTEIDSERASTQLAESFGGRLGKAVAPLFAPIGYDWKLTIGILGSLAAREVFVATMGTVFALGSVDENTEGLTKVLRESRDASGAPAYTIATCLSLLVFFAFSLQCISTIGVARRETNSWKIPAAMFGYMFTLAYVSAFFVYWGSKSLFGV
ncbi:MAG: nucleoside recognition domain-containing protein, partial [Bdellovibrionota bacterium]